MKKIYLIFLITYFFFNSVCYGFSFNKKKEKPVLYISPIEIGYQRTFEQKLYNLPFRVNSRIYFSIYSPNGFKSDYIRYQIVKQDDKVEVGGYTRERNKTVRVKDKYYYTDYFVLTSPGKYFLQVFDITNLHQWLAIAQFLVIE